MATYTPVKLAYETFESKNGSDENLSPVIFMHGLTGSKEMYDDIPQAVADKTRRKVYVYDARNHGDSQYTDDFNFDMNVDDLFHFMDTMCIQKAVLVGSSMGGLTATNAALRKPERIEMIFSEDMFVKKIPKELLEPVTGYVKMWVESVQEIPKGLNEADAIRFAIDNMFSKLPKDTPLIIGERETFYKSNIKIKRKPDGGYDVNFNSRAILQSLSNIEALMSEPTGEFSGPAYFIYGSLSPFEVIKEEKNIRKHFPKAQFIEFTGATHEVHVEFPNKFKETISNILQQ